MKKLIVAAAVSLLPFAVFAEEAKEAPAPPATPAAEFSCFEMTAIATISAENNNVLINNFMLSEDKAMGKPGLSEVKFSYSLVNRSGNTARVSGDIVISDGSGGTLAALTARPMLGIIQSGRTETIDAWTYVNEGTLAKAKTFCVRVAIAM